MPAYVIYINGWPGVGKLTIARSLQDLIPGSQILHNHELIDPVETKYRRGGPWYTIKRGEYRRSQTNHNECVGDYTDLALGELGRRFYSVILHCELEENERRLRSAGRGEVSKGKLTDVEVLRLYRRRGSIYKFGDDDELEVDVSTVDAKDVAKMILEFVEKREQEGRSGMAWEEGEPDYDY